MFTGLIKDIGKIRLVEINLEGKIFEIETSLIKEIAADDSISVNGVCLTATKVFESSFRTQAVHLTLDKTNLNHLTLGSSVNLELSLRYSDRLGGHLVSGHVNGVATVCDISHCGENYNIWYEVPAALSKFIMKEGSVALDGISLTVADLNTDNNMLMVTIIPHTWNETQMHNLVIGSAVNLEVDSNAVMMATYIEAMFNKFIKEKGL